MVNYTVTDSIEGTNRHGERIELVNDSQLAYLFKKGDLEVQQRFNADLFPIGIKAKKLCLFQIVIF